MNSWLLIGHRGVGKTALLKKLQDHFANSSWSFLSLDEEIEKKAGLTIDLIFKEKGEPYFRSLEQTTLNEISGENRVIDVGAGFEGPLPSSFRVLWVKRKIDSSRSVFLNRPSLDGSLQISEKRFQEREKRYEQWSDLSLVLREGERNFSQGESLFFQALLDDKWEREVLRGWTWTLPQDFSKESVSILTRLGLEQFEWRNDWIENRPDVSPLLTSLRDPSKKDSQPKGSFDWPLEWGTREGAEIYSLHSRKESLKETLSELPENSKGHIKLAIPIHNFEELWEGHQWMMQAPSKRSFLPLSIEGRWSWYRLLTSRVQGIKFLQFGKASAPDQPTLLEILNFNPQFEKFAAILGSPIVHSQTPTFHQAYFSQKGLNVLGVEMSESEFASALPVLEKLGLVAAAVTSPLKEAAALLVQTSEPAINTLHFDGAHWRGKSTDFDGLKSLLPAENRREAIVWGGGGVLPDIKKLVPNAPLYSSRTGELKEGQPIDKPKHLIWAAGSALFSKQGVFPPDEGSIQSVYDLNYTQDSPARSFAHKVGCQYRSGLVMFAAQAEKQQEFWNECGL